MKRTNLTTLLIACVLLFCASDGHAKIKQLTYHSFANEDSDEVIAVTEVIIKDLDNGQKSIVRKKQHEECLMTDDFLLDPNGDLISWHRTCPESGSDFKLDKTGDMAELTGEFNGEALSKVLELGNQELHIYPKYSLAPFAFSDREKMKFSSLRRDKLQKLPMQAIRKGEGTLNIQGKDVEAVKVYYSIVGKLREKYYNHNYYYRKSDGLFIKKRQQDGRIEVLVEEK